MPLLVSLTRKRAIYLPLNWAEVGLNFRGSLQDAPARQVLLCRLGQNVSGRAPAIDELALQETLLTDAPQASDSVKAVFNRLEAFDSRTSPTQRRIIVL